MATLDAQQSNFQLADAIPTASLPAATVPWALFAVGVVVAVLGVWFLVRPSRLDAIIAVAVGIALAVGPLLLSTMTKSVAADNLNEAMAPIYTEAMVDGAYSALATIDAMTIEMQTELLPDLATQLEVTPVELFATLGQQLPATSAALASSSESMGRFEVMVGAFDANLSNYEILRPVEFEPIVWAMLLGGLVTVLGGALPLAFERFLDRRVSWHRPQPTPIG